MGWADDRGFERWRSDAIRLSNRLEARVAERGGGGEEEHDAAWKGLGERREGVRLWYGVCESADGRSEEMWLVLQGG